MIYYTIHICKFGTSYITDIFNFLSRDEAIKYYNKYCTEHKKIGDNIKDYPLHTKESFHAECEDKSIIYFYCQKIIFQDE